MNKSLKIYIASSFRNLHAVQLLRDKLTDQGHKVLDFTEFTPPLPEHLKPKERRAALDADEYGNIFSFCTESCASANISAASFVSADANELEVLKRKKLLTPKEVQKLYGLNANTLANKRSIGKGADYIQEFPEGPVFYEHSALKKYLDSCRKKSYEQ